MLRGSVWVVRVNIHTLVYIVYAYLDIIFNITHDETVTRNWIIRISKEGKSSGGYFRQSKEQ